MRVANRGLVSGGPALRECPVVDMSRVGESSGAVSPPREDQAGIRAVIVSLTPLLRSTYIT